MEATKRLTRMGQIRRSQTANGLDDVELGELIEPIQLAHALFGKSHLVHRFSSVGWCHSISPVISRTDRPHAQYSIEGAHEERLCYAPTRWPQRFSNAV